MERDTEHSTERRGGERFGGGGGGNYLQVYTDLKVWFNFWGYYQYEVFFKANMSDSNDNLMLVLNNKGHYYCLILRSYSTNTQLFKWSLDEWSTLINLESYHFVNDYHHHSSALCHCGCNMKQWVTLEQHEMNKFIAFFGPTLSNISQMVADHLPRTLPVQEGLRTANGFIQVNARSR